MAVCEARRGQRRFRRNVVSNLSPSGTQRSVGNRLSRLYDMTTDGLPETYYSTVAVVATRHSVSPTRRRDVMVAGADLE